MRRLDGSSDPVASGGSDGGSWLVRIDTRTFHDLFVGGRCAASWRIDVGIAVADGSIDSAGAATIKGELRCDEPTAQVQAERLDLRAVGVFRDGQLRFRLEETGRSPDGSQELSGFVETILTLRFRMPANDGATRPDRRRSPRRWSGYVGRRRHGGAHRRHRVGGDRGRSPSDVPPERHDRLVAWPGPPEAVEL